jgi:hypothetical protein
LAIEEGGNTQNKWIGVTASTVCVRD